MNEGCFVGELLEKVQLSSRLECKLNELKSTTVLLLFQKDC